MASKKEFLITKSYISDNFPSDNREAKCRDLAAKYNISRNSRLSAAIDSTEAHKAKGIVIQARESILKYYGKSCKSLIFNYMLN